MNGADQCGHGTRCREVVKMRQLLRQELRYVATLRCVQMHNAIIHIAVAGRAKSIDGGAARLLLLKTISRHLA